MSDRRIDDLLAELRSTEALIRAEAARFLPWPSLIAIERQADLVAAELLGGGPTDDALQAAPDELPTAPLSTVVAEAVSDEMLDEVESLDAEDFEALDDLEALDEADEMTPVAALDLEPLPVLEEDGGDEATVSNTDFVFEDDGPAFADEPTQDAPREVEAAATGAAAAAGAAVAAGAAAAAVSYVSYVTEDDEPLVSDEGEPTYVQEDAPRGDRSMDDTLVQGDDASDEAPATHVPLDRYVVYEDEPVAEPEPERPAPRAAPPVSNAHASLVTYVEEGEDDLFADEGGGRPEPARAAPAKALPEEEIDIDEPSFSDVGEDALAEVEEPEDLLADGIDEVESFDLMPGEPTLDDEEVTLVSGLEEMAPSSDLEEVADDPSSSEVLLNRVSPLPAPRAPVAAVAAASAAPRVTAGLYGNPNVPTIREGSDTAPKAAAVQLNAGGTGGRMVGLEEEVEPIAIGSAEDYGEEVDYEADGLSIAIQEYEEEEEEEEELELEVEAPQAPEVAAPKGPSAAEVKAMFDAASRAAELGQLQEAADLFSDVIDADDDHLDAHVARGRLYLDLGDYARAMSDFMVAEEIDERSPEPQVAIGDLYFHRKDYRKAIDYFNAALQMSPNHAMAYCRRGISHYYRKNYKDAVDDLERANKLDPEIPNISSFISMAKRKAKAAPAPRR